jgi:hypothetical protein
VRNN